MFFFKKRKGQEPGLAPAADRRGEYREELPETECSITRTVDGTSATFVGALVTVTARGIGIEFPPSSDPKLKVDEVIDLDLYHSSNEWSVSTPARVRQVDASDDGARCCGFEFVNVGDLYAQLEGPLECLFNRRGEVRARPDWDLLVPVMIRRDGICVRAAIYDLTSRGMGIALPVDSKLTLETGDDAEIAFRLPHSQNELVGSVNVRRVAELTDRALVGVEFDLDEVDGLRTHQDAISAFVIQRMEELASWERSWSA